MYTFTCLYVHMKVCVYTYTYIHMCIYVYINFRWNICCEFPIIRIQYLLVLRQKIEIQQIIRISFDLDDDVYLEKLQTRGIKKIILYM
jgi:hypothetical protein